MLYNEKKSITAPTVMLQGLIPVKSDYSIQFMQKEINLFIKNRKKLDILGEEYEFRKRN